MGRSVSWVRWERKDYKSTFSRDGFGAKRAKRRQKAWREREREREGGALDLMGKATLHKQRRRNFMRLKTAHLEGEYFDG